MPITTPATGVGPQFTFSLREALSDISGMKILGGQPGIPIELDYSLAANAGLSVMDSFITPATIPSSTLWNAGTWIVLLNLIGADSLSLTVALYQADTDGNILGQIGTTPSVKTAADASPANPVILDFEIVGPLVQASKTDRIIVQVLAQNNDAANSHELALMASVSGVASSVNIPLELGNQDNPFRRNKFLGFFFPPGYGAPYFNEHGQNLDTYSLP